MPTIRSLLSQRIDLRSWIVGVVVLYALLPAIHFTINSNAAIDWWLAAVHMAEMTFVKLGHHQMMLMTGFMTVVLTLEVVAIAWATRWLWNRAIAYGVSYYAPFRMTQSI